MDRRGGTEAPLIANRSEPIAQEELADLFAEPLVAADGIALAVSGGSDSTALMLLYSDWLALAGLSRGAVTVLTVDHRLRAQSGEEAQAVARLAHELGFRHATLAWEGPHPRSGVQAAARRARYALIARYAARHGISTVLTGHTAEDQAETLLMRLARGSGIAGLAAMAPWARPPSSPLDVPPPAIVRPFLATPKARLIATLRARAVAWREDPSNGSPAFERTRLRQAWPALEAVGLKAEKLTLSARRARRAHEALERWVSDVCNPERGCVRVDPCGFVHIERTALTILPLEVAIRLLERAAAAAGGGPTPVPLARLEAIAGKIAAGARSAWTLARAKITARASEVLLEREWGRSPLPELDLAAGARTLWDARFVVTIETNLVEPVRVRALGATGLEAAAWAAALRPDAPRGALSALPAFCRGERVLAVPSLGYWAECELKAALGARFHAARLYNLGELPHTP